MSAVISEPTFSFSKSLRLGSKSASLQLKKHLKSVGVSLFIQATILNSLFWMMGLVGLISGPGLVMAGSLAIFGNVILMAQARQLRESRELCDALMNVSGLEKEIGEVIESFSVGSELWEETQSKIGGLKDFDPQQASEIGTRRLMIALQFFVQKKNEISALLGTSSGLGQIYSKAETTLLLVKSPINLIVGMINILIVFCAMM